MFDATDRIVVGTNCMIGPYCYITDHDHGTAGSPVSAQPYVSAPVSIGDDCWLGAGVVVLKGVRIGAGAVIGAGSVVTRDIPVGDVVVGNPPRKIRSRLA
ncbi:MAG: acyltransferase [Planctomycetes bacterium]|nr:acyltransferase [Planctomycetota bacterium]